MFNSQLYASHLFKPDYLSAWRSAFAQCDVCVCSMLCVFVCELKRFIKFHK